MKKIGLTALALATASCSPMHNSRAEEDAAMAKKYPNITAKKNAAAEASITPENGNYCGENPSANAVTVATGDFGKQATTVIEVQLQDYYTVEEGESLSDIAYKHRDRYGDLTLNEITESITIANSGSMLDTIGDIQPGVQILLPEELLDN